LKKIWWLYIIFILFFFMGDIISTMLVTGAIEISEEVMEEIKIDPDCICTVPPKCDTSSVINKEENTKDAMTNIIIVKMICVVLVGLMIFFFKEYTWLALMMLVLVSSGATTMNLSSFFFAYRAYLIFALGIIWILILAFFVNFKEEKE